MDERRGALMATSRHDELARHVGHFIECLTYADGRVALECVMCAEVLYDVTEEAAVPPEEWSPRYSAR
jgi:hypothetical protein